MVAGGLGNVVYRSRYAIIPIQFVGGLQAVTVWAVKTVLIAPGKLLS